MTIYAVMTDTVTPEKFVTAQTDQVEFFLMWHSRQKWHGISQVTFTHNPEYPTPAINVVAPNPGIRFTVTDQDGNVLYTNVKPKEDDK